MRKYFFIVMLFSLVNAKSQTTYDAKIEKLAAEIAAAFEKEEKIIVGFDCFSYNEKQTKLTQLIYDDLSADLVFAGSNHKKIIVSGHTKLIAVKGFADVQPETDKAILLGRENATRFVCFGKISDSENGYKVVIKLYETKGGNLVSAFKTTLDKSKTLEDLNMQVVSDKKNDPQIMQAADETPRKEKKKKEGKFWKFLGETAMTSGSQIINHSIEKKLSQSRSSQETVNRTPANQAAGNQTASNPITSSQIPDNFQADPETSSSSFSGDCKGYVNIINRTENTISIKVYKENPSSSFGVRAIYSLTIAPGKTKKQKIDKGVEYFYYATNNTSAPIIGSYREFEGTFEAENCNETIDEEIE